MPSLTKSALLNDTLEDLPPGGARTVRTLSPTPAQGDLYQLAIAQLLAAGFSAEIRTYRLGREAECRTVAVYIHEGDPRLGWSAQSDSARIPAFPYYRREGRHGHSITLFSGPTPAGIPALLALLLKGGRLDACPPKSEWDPYQVDAGEQAEIERQVHIAQELVSGDAPPRRRHRL